MIGETFALTWNAAAAACVGLLFVTGAAGKLRHRALLPAVIANYRLLPAFAAAPFARLLPWGEGLIGLLLIADVGAAATIPAAALLLLFAFAMDVNIRRGRRHIDCGCGLGALRQPLRHALVMRNLLLAAALLPGLMASHGADIAVRVIGGAAGLAAFVLLLLLNALLALPHTRPQAA